MQEERVQLFYFLFKIVIELLRANRCQLLSKPIKPSPLLALKLNLIML